MAPVLLSSSREKSLDAWKRERNDKKIINPREWRRQRTRVHLWQNCLNRQEETFDCEWLNEHIVRENNKELCFTVRWSFKKVLMKMRRSPLSWRGGDETVCVLANPNFTTLSLSTFTWGDFVNDLGEFRSIDKDAVKSRITHCFLFWGKSKNFPSNVFRHEHLMNDAFTP